MCMGAHLHCGRRQLGGASGSAPFAIRGSRDYAPSQRLPGRVALTIPC
jgi:hypothetical protein